MSIGVDARAKVTASKILRPEQTHGCDFEVFEFKSFRYLLLLLSSSMLKEET